MIKYRKGYKYQLAEDYKIQTDIIGFSVDLQFIKLYPAGLLKIRSGYAWDGASGPTIDTDSSMEGSLSHDALYQLLRMSLIPPEYRVNADLLLKKVCKAEGMWAIRASLWEIGVRLFASNAAAPKNRKKVYTTGKK
jgi:hypothetical protein